jgi:hypothetical protein
MYVNTSNHLYLLLLKEEVHYQLWLFLHLVQVITRERVLYNFVTIHGFSLSPRDTSNLDNK